MIRSCSSTDNLVGDIPRASTSTPQCTRRYSHAITLLEVASHHRNESSASIASLGLPISLYYRSCADHRSSDSTLALASLFSCIYLTASPDSPRALPVRRRRTWSQAHLEAREHLNGLTHAHKKDFAQRNRA